MKAKPVHAMVADAVVQYRRHHGGLFPRCLVTERDALIVASLEGKMGLKDLPVRVVEAVEKSHLARPGGGNALALVLMELPGDRFGAAVVEFNEQNPVLGFAS